MVTVQSVAGKENHARTTGSVSECRIQIETWLTPSDNQESSGENRSPGCREHEANPSWLNPRQKQNCST